MKNILRILLPTFFLLLCTFNSDAQNVGINNIGAAPDNSALLDLNSTDKGFLITRADTLNITSPAFGLMTLSPVDSCLYLYNGSNWMGMGGAGSNCSCNYSNGTQPEPPCGTPFTDSRDGEAYGTVQIGNQCWMSENLNYKPNSGKSWCYDNDDANCVTYGRLYDWDTAMNGEGSSNTVPSGVKGLCPDGWHFPSDAEWIEMEIALGMPPAIANNQTWRGTTEGDALKSSSNWNGNNSSGFNALPSGRRDIDIVGSFNRQGSYSFWWSSTEFVSSNNSLNAYFRYLRTTYSNVYRMMVEKRYGYSVRCVKD